VSIVIDFNQVMLATLFVAIGNHTNTELDENIVRHMFLTSILHNRKKFKDEFGEIIICADSRNSWRKELFPYYKANRKKSRAESDLDWNELFRLMTLIREELDEYFPYKVLCIDSCEADDIIGTYCHDHGMQLGGDKILILSGDKDYIQLHKYANIKQYNPTLKKYVLNSEPERFLSEQILKGDSGDGVPNVLSPDNCLVIGERQKPMTAKRIEEFTSNPDKMDETTKLRYSRNKQMIDLEQIPDKYKEQIREAYRKEKTVGRSKLFSYFTEKKLKLLLTDIQDF
jgi:5'-3' exonuclease